jgi:hypothetical protein
MSSDPDGATQPLGTTLWTQHLGVRWPNSLAFFEHRYEILRSFDEQGLLRFFRHAENRVDVRLGDADHLLSFGASGMMLSALKPKADLDRLAAAGRVVVEALAPRRLSGLTASMQWIGASHDGDYDQARSRACEHALGEPGSGRYLDYAAVVDGDALQSGATYHLEAGVADAADIAHRLNRAFVSVRGAGQGGNIDAPPTLWPADSMPPFGLFCNSTWQLSRAVCVPGWDDAESHFASIRKAAFQIVDSIFTALDNEPREIE